MLEEQRSQAPSLDATMIASTSATTATTNALIAPASSSSASSSSQHYKKPSASSISSSSSTSTKSKTAAFFGSSHTDLAIRPAAATIPSSSSTGSLRRHDRSRTSLQSNRDVADEDEENLASSFRHGIRSTGLESYGAEMTGSHSSQHSHQHADAYLESGSVATDLGRSTSSSSAFSNTGGGRRSWIDFEGKPIVPLPSPAIANESRQLGDGVPAILNQQYGQMALSSDDQHESARQNLSIDTSMRRAPSTSNAAVAQHAAKLAAAATVEKEHHSGTMVDSPKTSSFFGGSGGKGAGHRSRKSEVDVSPVSPSPLRISSDMSSLRAPSRYPSIIAHHPRPGWSSPEEDDGSASTRLSDHAPQIAPMAVMGSQPLVPAAFISPPTPVLDTDMQAAFTPASRKGYARHTHGPSDNVTSSSILPQAELVQLADRGQQAYRTGMQHIVDHHIEPIRRDSATGTPRPTAVAAAVESEDEGAQRIGSFVVERVLGTGAFSRVILARRIRAVANAVEVASVKQSGGLVALKMLEKEPCRQNERMRVSWVREVEVLKHILHPNIVRFLTSYSTTRHHVLVLECVEGGELFEYLAQEQRQLADREWLVRRLFGELAGAVGWMHSINLVHRDVKLENIILTRQFRRSMDTPTPHSFAVNSPLLKLSDFGLSRFIDPANPLLETRCGSEEYAAPELIIGKRYDGRQTDVWALGVVLYALLSGALPFVSESAGTINAQGNVDGISSGREQRGGVEQDLQARLARKAQLLRIAKGDLRWPSNTNDLAVDRPDPSVCPPQHRLITPAARLLVARLLRRDATKRATAWDVWDERWMVDGSFSGAHESSAVGQIFTPPLDPRSVEGQTWLSVHARVHAGAPDVVHDD